MTKQDPRHTGHEEGRDVQSIHTAIIMPDQKIPKKMRGRKLSIENYRKESAPKATRKTCYKDTLKASLNDQHTNKVSRQNRQHRLCLISKETAHHEEKKICEAERKRRERKAIVDGPSPVFSTLTCSTYNRQFIQTNKQNIYVEVAG